MQKFYSLYLNDTIRLDEQWPLDVLIRNAYILATYIEVCYQKNIEQLANNDGLVSTW
jgi:hypothetical protein